MFIAFWRKVTNNQFILSVVEFGYSLQFSSLPPILHLTSGSFSDSRFQAVSTQVSILSSKTAISTISPSPDQFVSPIFDVPKKDCDDVRVILNLKILNTFIRKTHFKLEGLDTIISMLRPGDYFVSIDLKDAYLMLLMHPDSWRFLCFEWDDIRYFYRCMPFGLTSAPRIFTKVFKQVLVFLRGKGLRVSAWFDDIILIASSVSLLLEQLHFCKLTLRSLGFIPHPDKSMLVPSQKIYHLGFDWDSVAFTLSVPLVKLEALRSLCLKAISSVVSLRYLNKILGTVESFRVAFPYAALYYRGLQREVAYYISRGSLWDDTIDISLPAKADLQWWLSCSPDLHRSLHPFVHDFVLTTDSSESGWGAVSSSGEDAYGFWDSTESLLHINVLETKAVLFGLRSLFRDYPASSILVRSDNISTVSYINNFGGRSSAIFEVVKDIYSFIGYEGIG